MADQCQYLEYRELSDGTDANDVDDADAGEEPRAYCNAADQFVQAMRADICNRRYGLDPETDCEFYRDAEGLPEFPGSEAGDGDDAVAGGENE